MRRCHDEGFDNKKPNSKGWRVDDHSPYYSFCPAKALRSESIADLFVQCKTSYLVGEYPKEGRLEDQESLFADNYVHFIEAWKRREYASIWSDVVEFTPHVLEAIAKMFGGK